MKRTRHAYVDGERDRAAERLSPAMWGIIHDLAQHGDPFHSRSDRAAGSLRSLQRLGFVKGEKVLTPAGRRLTRVVWKETHA